MGQTQETVISIVKSPLTQAAAAGALVLIPARRYPAWLRQTLTWGSTAAAAGIIALPRAELPAPQTSAEEGAEREGPARSHPMGPLARAGLAAGAGAVVYGSWRFTWWFDEASEQALRKLRVPFPRAVMGAACGIWFYRMDKAAREQITA